MNVTQVLNYFRNSKGNYTGNVALSFVSRLQDTYRTPGNVQILWAAMKQHCSRKFKYFPE